jgi:hypothetical protein
MMINQNGKIFERLSHATELTSGSCVGNISHSRRYVTCPEASLIPLQPRHSLLNFGTFHGCLGWRLKPLALSMEDGISLMFTQSIKLEFGRRLKNQIPVVRANSERYRNC